ncbi:hypothetical protein ABIB06_007030 [Bradyrhizobium sp. LB8.2]|uniref:hypothetical protein n=1 Tax=unclassified Bradyrhizobium TaxID=2631580 RepID=UPI003397F251
MDETPTTDRVPAASDPWRSVYIATPRRLDGKKYAMIVNRDGGEETIAHNVTIAQALIIALEHRRELSAIMFYRDRGAFREYVIGRRRLIGGAFEPVLRGVVPRTTRLATDHVRALQFFEEIIEHDPRAFFDGRLVRFPVSRRNNVIGGKAS